ncbi:MAG: 50S ribosomal protein L10 [Nanoarchaeota archaeon]|nr:50S ribosomal protein L10 [Nanoarchaeota archaeon]
MKETKQFPEAKKQVLDDYIKLMKEYPIIGAVNMANLPTKQLQNMRAQLRGKVVLKVGKRRIMKLALEEAAKTKKGLEQLIPHLKGMPGLIFTKENPFSLCKTLAKNKSTAPAKAGQIAPKDILVKAGPTSFAPGPIIGQLGSIGIPAGIEGGKVAIKKDAVVVKEGKEISADVAGILLRLGIEPMEIGLDLTATYEDGNIFTKNILSIDESQYIDNVTTAHRWAFNLAMEAGILTKETTELMITKAVREARSLSVEAHILTKDTTDLILAKVANQASALQAQLNI